VHISIGVFTLRGEGVVYLSNDLSGDEYESLPDRGVLACTFDKVPFMPGVYSVNIYCTVNGVLSDWITDAAYFEVSEGDYFGSGKVPPAGYGSVLVAHNWRVEQTDLSPAQSAIDG
jgi:lipopolysaccharide transport system ATP-binding protein